MIVVFLMSARGIPLPRQCVRLRLKSRLPPNPGYDRPVLTSDHQLHLQIYSPALASNQTHGPRHRDHRLPNGGALEHAQEMAAHESPRTTKLYDRTKERLTQDEVERIRL